MLNENLEFSILLFISLNVLIINKDFENSLEYHQVAVSTIKNIFDENHPEFSTSMSGLANAYRDAGDIIVVNNTALSFVAESWHIVF